MKFRELSWCEQNVTGGNKAKFKVGGIMQSIGGGVGWGDEKVGSLRAEAVLGLLGFLYGNVHYTTQFLRTSEYSMLTRTVLYL